jgi:ATP-dependent exoDNAse (exonuclease V) beta subunit
VAGQHGDIDCAETVKDFLSMCDQSEVRTVLMRSSYPAKENIDVESERRFAVRREGKLLHGSMDRLVLRRIGNEVVGLEIIDFKTDRPGGETEMEFLADRQKVYTPQMHAYRQAVEKLYPNVREIVTKLVFTSVNRVAEIE